jgi:hypothetical protein
MKKFIPILFTTDMMVANLQGIKNQTRRGRGLDVINENPNLWELHMVNRHDYISVVFNELDYDMSEKRVIEVKSPYGQPGDVLWFREKWRRNEAMTGPPFHWYALNDVYTDPDNERWKPGIHMPSSACRAFGVIEEIRIERLNDISHMDAINEGILCTSSIREVSTDNHWYDYKDKSYYLNNPRLSYFSLFESINGKELTNKNPWLWQVKYKFTTEEPEGWKEYVQKLNKEP